MEVDHLIARWSHAQPNRVFLAAITGALEATNVTAFRVHGHMWATQAHGRTREQASNHLWLGWAADALLNGEVISPRVRRVLVSRCRLSASRAIGRRRRR